MKLFVAIAIVALIGGKFGSFVEARVVPGLQSELITRGQVLLTRANAAVRELQNAHNVHEAAIIQSEEARISVLMAELLFADDTTSVAQLEHQLSDAEHQLTYQLEKINHRVALEPIGTH